MTWTVERKEIAFTMWRDGRSASQIAMKLGGVTRNAVIGVISRAGLSARNRPAPPSKPKTLIAAAAPRPVRRPMPAGVMVLAPQTGGDKATAARAENIEARANPPENVLLMARAFAPLPGREPVPFGSKGCRWPVSFEGADMRQCGCERDGARPYCAPHAKAAYQPAQSKKRSDAADLARGLRRWAA